MKIDSNSVLLINNNFGRKVMLWLILIYAAISVVSATVLLYFIKTAPNGWEDENGFHMNAQLKRQKF